MLHKEGMLDTLKQSVSKAGDLALEFFGKDINIDIKKDGSQVSAADHAVNDLLEQELSRLDPSIKWLSEESPVDDSRLNAPHVWIIDPIDGTRGFLENKPDWTIVAALIEENRPVLSVVYNPVKSELYSAEAGKGAFLNDKKISTSTTTDLSKAHIISSKGHFNRVFTEETQKPSTRTWNSSMAYRIARIAEGAADATISLTPKNDWDIAAAHLILEEAGGQMSTHLGNTITYNNQEIRHPSVVAATKSLYKPIINKTEQAIKQN